MIESTNFLLNSYRPKSKSKYSVSKPSFLIPSNAVRFLNIPVRKSQTPTRLSNTDTNTCSTPSPILSPHVSSISKKSKILNNTTNNNTINSGNIINQKHSSIFSTNSNTNKNNDLFNLLHRKNHNSNNALAVIRESKKNNNDKSKFLAKSYINPLTYSTNENNKIQVKMISTKNYKNSQGMTANSSPYNAQSKGINIIQRSPNTTLTRAASVNGLINKKNKNVNEHSIRKINKNDLNCKSISNNNSNNSSRSNLVVKQYGDLKKDKSHLMLKNNKSSSEKKLQVFHYNNYKKINTLNSDQPKIKIAYKSNAIFSPSNSNTNQSRDIISKLNTNNTNNTNKKKQFRDVNNSPLLRTKGTTNNSTNKKPKRQDTPISQNIKATSLISPEAKKKDYDAESNFNSITKTNTIDINNSNNNILCNCNCYSNHITRPLLALRDYPNHINHPIKKTIIKIDSISKKGFAGPNQKKVNQDNYFIYKNINREHSSIFLGVCDGHGIVGHDVSGYLISHLPATLNSSLISKRLPLCNQENLNCTLHEAFMKVNSKVNNDPTINTDFSGSTCVTIIYTPEKITCANVGDSRAVMGKCVNGTWSSMNLSRDHKPNQPDEYERIIKAKGRIGAYKDNEGNLIGPERVWLMNEDIPGLAMSRSFGDKVAQSVGVISKPEILEFSLETSDKFVILASDGIWEFIDSDECVNMIKDFYLQNDAYGALNYLYQESAKRWILQEEVIDDISAVIIFFE